MSDYQEMVREESRRFFDEIHPSFEKDEGKFGGASDNPNLAKWLDENRKLFQHIDEISKSWGRADAEMINSNSRNAVPYGNPKESAYFAFHKDILQELKKIRKGKQP